MNKLLALLVCLTLLLLSGCSASSQVENQAYALSLGVDRLEDGALRLSVQVPSLDKSASSGSEDGSEQGGEGKSYLVNTATGDTFSNALDLLVATVPHTLRLSQLKSVVFSQEIARDERFDDILRDMLFTYQLNTGAACIICRDDAHDFIKAQSPAIGTRLSNAMTTELEHYQSLGYIPRATLGDVFYTTESIYGDPMAILANLASGSADAAPERIGDELPGDVSRQGPNKNEYFGAALLRQGQMVGVLNGLQTKLVNMLTNQLKAFSYSCDGLSVRLSLAKKPQVSIDLSGDAPRIQTALELRVQATDRFPQSDTLKDLLMRDLTELTNACQRLSVDPFNYALYAAASFKNTRDWLAYGWHERFSLADITYELSLTQSEQ